MEAVTKTEVEIGEDDIEVAVENYIRAQFPAYELGEFMSSDLPLGRYKIVFRKSGATE